MPALRIDEHLGLVRLSEEGREKLLQQVPRRPCLPAFGREGNMYVLSVKPYRSDTLPIFVISSDHIEREQIRRQGAGTSPNHVVRSDIAQTEPHSIKQLVRNSSS